MSMMQSTEPIVRNYAYCAYQRQFSHPKQSEVVPSPRKTKLSHPDAALSRKCGKALQFSKQKRRITEKVVCSVLLQLSDFPRLALALAGFGKSDFPATDRRSGVRISQAAEKHLPRDSDHRFWEHQAYPMRLCSLHFRRNSNSRRSSELFSKLPRVGQT